MSDPRVNIIVDATDKASGVLRGVGSALGTIGGAAALGAVAAIGALGAGFVASAKMGMEMNAMLEKTTLQFTTLMGDADKAKEHVANLFEFAGKTPFETEPILNASKALLTFGGDALNTMDNLGMVGDAAAAVNQPIEDVAFWVGRAYSAIQAGRPFGEAAARLQEMGILSADTRTALEELQASGAEGSEVWDTLTGSLGKFSGAMELQSGTWEGLMSTLSDGIKIASATAFKPFFDLAKDGLAGITTFVSGDTFAGWAQMVADIFSGQVIPAISSAISWIGTYLPVAIQIASDFWTTTLQPAIATVWTWLSTVLIPFIQTTIIPFLQEYIPLALQFLSDVWTTILLPAIQFVWNFLTTVLVPFLMATIVPILQVVIPAAIQFLSDAWTTVLKPAIEAVWTWLNTVLIPFLQNTVIPFLQEYIPVALQVLSDFWTNTLKPAIEAVWSWISTVLVPFITDTLIPVLQDTLGAAIQTLTDFWTNTLQPALELVWGFIQDSVIPLFQALADLFTTVVGVAITALTGLWENTLLPALTTIWDFISTSLSPVFEAISELLDNTFGPAVSGASGFLDTLKGALDGIGSAISGVIGWIGDMIDSLNNIELPSWLTPGSPTPFELGLRGISDALKEVNGLTTDVTFSPKGLQQSPRGGNNSSYYNLTLYTNARSSTLEREFNLMKARVT